jgi:catechol 2,3-dioxygenase
VDAWAPAPIGARAERRPLDAMTHTDSSTADDDRRGIDPRVDIGHVHLKVSDLERAVAFYRDALGFSITGRLGDRAAFLAADDYHHHIGLDTFASHGGTAPPNGATGLYHVAIRYPTRASLARALRRLHDHGIELTGASDHGANEALYLSDPDGNGLELSWDRPRNEWPRTVDGQLALVNLPLDVEALLDADNRGEATCRPTR